MSDVILGRRPPEAAERDAVHVAVIPAMAGEILAPGHYVRFCDGVAKRCVYQEAHGIVDPYLDAFVGRGDRFWMCLMPGSVTGMRHHWSHPSIADDQGAATDTTKQASEAWLRDFCERNDCPSYDQIILAVTEEPWYVEIKEHFYFNGIDAHGEIPPEFWHHLEIVTGKKFKRRPTSFSCSC